MSAPPDVSITLSSDNGSVPPPHRRSTRLTIGPDGAGERVVTRGYGDDTTHTAFQLSPGALTALHDDLHRLGAFSTTWHEAEARRVGGGGQSVRVTAGGETTEIPRQLDPTQRGLRDAVVARIRAAVPT